MKRRLISLIPIHLSLCLMGLAALTLSAAPRAIAQTSERAEITFKTVNDITVYGDLYLSSNGKTAPIVLLFHQAGSNARAEYGGIATRLLENGYNVLAIDQRSGGSRLGGTNRTLAEMEEESVPYCDAYPDLEAALEYARQEEFSGKLFVWGSSYSAALVLRLATEHGDQIDGVLAFSPASGGSMAACAPHLYLERVETPLLALRPASEMERQATREQLESIEAMGFETYVAENGVHGSSMLNPDRVEGSPEPQWEVVLAFLDQHSASGVGPSGFPSTDIFLAALSTRNGMISVESPRNITKRAGYDNQPSFTPDGGGILYTSYLEDQSDIFLYEMRSRRSKAFTNTAESEYSPYVTPDGEYISVVRVEGDSTQRIWRYPVDGSEPEVLFESMTGVGYYAWADENTAIAFIIGDPTELHVADVPSGRSGALLRNIGRSFGKVPNVKAMGFMQQQNDDSWEIRGLDLESGSSRPFIEAVPGSQDFAWMPSGILLMSDGTELFQWNPASNRGWLPIHNFESDGILNVSRLAVSPDGSRIAFVGADQ